MNWSRAQNFSLRDTQLDYGIVAGLGVSLVLVLFGVALSGKASNFIDPMSLFVVLGGTFGATLVHFSTYDLRQALHALRDVLVRDPSHPSERIEYIVTLAQSVRASGLLVLERESESTRDPFLKRGLQLTVDGQSEADVKRILETEMRVFYERAGRAAQVFQILGNYAPALGLIGTLIGLIQMLGGLDNPATVGPAMSLALVTTLYGAVLANLVFLPFAGKLRNHNDEESLVRAITLEGLLALGRQENPIIIEQRLQSFLPLAKAR